MGVEDQLEIDVQTRARGIILKLRGELDVASVGALEAALANARTAAPELIALDLRQLEFMDSTGLRAVLAASELAREDGRAFALVRGPDRVHRLLTLTRVAERLVVVDDPDELLVSK